ncbi:MAG: aminotransferase class I/II-fold pyridoxal phosphate-dependent enzyme, partial [Fimbriimonadaceae bacterium]
LGFKGGQTVAVNTLVKLKSNIDSKAFPAVAEAGAYALNHVSNQATLDIYQRRRDALVDGLRSIGWQVERPVASLYVWAPVPNPDMTSAEFAKALLEKAHVLCIPGNGYGTAGEGYVRFSLTLLGDQNGERFAEAVRRIAASGLIAAPVA